MRVAIIHYWLVSMRGGEKVIESLCKLFPDADIFTHIYDERKISSVINQHNVKTTLISKLPFAKRLFRAYLPIMPLALEQLDLTDYDLIISSESGPAKGVITRPDSLHICYCHSPMRYLWDQYHVYRREAGLATRLFMPFLAHFLRLWDASSATRVDRFVANSRFVARRIEKYYGRTAEVVHPPVDVESFTPSPNVDKGDGYLFLGELVPYKQPSVAVEAFTKMGKKLTVIGEGPEKNKLTRLAGPTIEFLPRQSLDDLKTQYQQTRALVFPGEEDFGIIPLEAQAMGTPVIALNRGGAKDTVIHDKTGILYDGGEASDLIRAVDQFEGEKRFDHDLIRTHALGFSEQRFLREIHSYIQAELDSRETHHCSTGFEMISA